MVAEYIPEPPCKPPLFGLLYFDSQIYRTHTRLTVSIPYHTSNRQLLLDNYSQKVLAPIAKEFGCKLARPFPIKTFPMELSGKVFEIHQDTFNGLCLRGITDYYIQDDILITRFDMLVRWDEQPNPAPSLSSRVT